MIILVAGIIGVSYYVIVILTCAPHISHGGFTAVVYIVVIVVFHVLVSFFVNNKLFKLEILILI